MKFIIMNPSLAMKVVVSLVLVTHDEYHEATVIEPTEEDGYSYLEIVNKYSNSNNATNSDLTSNESTTTSENAVPSFEFGVLVLLISLVSIKSRKRLLRS